MADKYLNRSGGMLIMPPDADGHCKEIANGAGIELEKGDLSNAAIAEWIGADMLVLAKAEAAAKAEASKAKEAAEAAAKA